MIRGIIRRDPEKQIRPIVARQVWLNESTAPVRSCGRDLAFAVAFVEEKLTKTERKDFQQHLLECRHCRQFVASEVRFRRPLVEEPSRSPDVRTRFFSIFTIKWAVPATAALLAAATFAIFAVNRNPKQDLSASNAPANFTKTPAVSSAAVSEPGTYLELKSRPGLATDDKTGPNSKTVNEVVAVASLPAVPVVPESAYTGSASLPGTNKTATDESFKIDASTTSNANTAANTANDSGTPILNSAALSNKANSANVTSNNSTQPSEYSVKVENMNLQTDANDLKARATDLKVDSATGSLGSIDRPSIIVPQAMLEEGTHSEVVIVSHSQLPASMMMGRSSGREEVEQQFDQYRSGNSQSNNNTIAYGGKWFTQVDKVWIDKDFTANADMPVIKVKMKSPEGQELLAKNPGLRPFLQLRKQVLVVYEGKVYLTY